MNNKEKLANAEPIECDNQVRNFKQDMKKLKKYRPLRMKDDDFHVLCHMPYNFEVIKELLQLMCKEETDKDVKVDVKKKSLDVVFE